MGCPEKVSAEQLFVPVHLHRLWARWSQRHKRDFQIPQRILCSSIYILRELLIYGDTIAPCLGCIDIIKELIEASDLGRFKRLVGNERSLQSPEHSPTDSRSSQRVPDNPEFRVELVSILHSWKISVKEVATATESEGHIFQEMDVRVQVGIRVLDISIH